MRIVSLLPAATEIVAALGCEAQLVGVSHECDYPTGVLGLPRVTTTPLDPRAGSAGIDRAVRELHVAGRPVIGVDVQALTALAPDLIITQNLCEVCAVADGEVYQLAAMVSPASHILTLEARSLDGIWADIQAVSQALARAEAGDELVRRLQARLGRLAERFQADAGPASRVLAVEWLDPLYLAGHWVPELIQRAGAENAGLEPGAHSVRISWRHAAALQPDLIILMLCGFTAERAETELASLADPDALALLNTTPTWILDGNAYTSRPGPRVVEGAEQIRAAVDNREVEGLRRARLPMGAPS